MNLQSAGVILRILNLVALADGGVSLEEETLLDSLSKQYKLQAKIINWEAQLSDPACIEEHPNLWQVLFSLFGNRFDFPVLS